MEENNFVKLMNIVSKENAELKDLSESIFTRYNYLFLILNRLDKETENILEKGDKTVIETDLMDTWALDVESFYIFAVSLFDILAKITIKVFYKNLENSKSLKDHFSHHRRFFLDNTNVDIGYSNILKKYSDWYVNFNGERSKFAHHYSFVIKRAREAPELSVFETAKTYYDKVNDYNSKILLFLCKYGEYFLKRIKKMEAM